MELSSKCSLYRNVKDDLTMAKYLTVLVEPLKSHFVQFRTSNHRCLPLELGRYNTIDRKDQLCTLYQTNDIGDGYHYLFICPYFNSRDKYIPKRCIRNPSILKIC